MQSFELTEEDKMAIELAKSTARLLLKQPSIEPLQIIGIGRALYALERLPLVTSGALCEFGIVYRAGTEDFSEMHHISFRVEEAEIAIGRGGSVYSKEVGSDSISEPGWRITIDGDRELGFDLGLLQATIDEYLAMGADIRVSDESAID